MLSQNIGPKVTAYIEAWTSDHLRRGQWVGIFDNATIGNCVLPGDNKQPFHNFCGASIFEGLVMHFQSTAICRVKSKATDQHEMRILLHSLCPVGLRLVTGQWMSRLKIEQINVAEFWNGYIALSYCKDNGYLLQGATLATWIASVECNMHIKFQMEKHRHSCLYPVRCGRWVSDLRKERCCVNDVSAPGFLSCLVASENYARYRFARLSIFAFSFQRCKVASGHIFNQIDSLKHWSYLVFSGFRSVQVVRVIC